MKRIKIMALVLSGVIAFTPVCNSIYAAQNNDVPNSVEAENMLGDLSQGEIDNDLKEKYNLNDNEIKELENEREEFTDSSNPEDVFSDEQVSLMKLEFQNTHGDEDTFKIVSNENNIVIEVNGAKGIIRTTVYKDNGEVESTFDSNYFEGLDNIKNSVENESIQPSIKTTTIQPLSKTAARASKKATNIVPSKQFGTGKIAKYFTPSIKVKRDTRDRITVVSTTKARTKKYSKDKYNWNSGNTLKFYNAINDARSSWSGIGKVLAAGALGKVAGYVAGLVAATSFAPPVSAVIAFLSGIGLVGTTGFAVASQITGFLGNMLTISNTYKKL